MGKLRNLNSDEILAQMFYAQKISRLDGLPKISNVVFMGMGEPADNLDNVINAAEVLTTRELFQLSQKKVVVSTVGPSPDVFHQLAKAPVALAWSVHAVNDKLRKRLVPTTKYSMAELRQGLIDALLTRPINSSHRSIMLEVALMAGVNDSMECADDLIEFSKVIVDQVPGCKLIVNLIPFNDIGHELYTRPTDESVQLFQKRIQNAGLFSHVRVTRGDDKTAACGQLATKKAKMMSP
uniref:Radical SAM core domain-containing protein n=1 Tax=Craspedostauros australis TaxID=1486917 RepID=A0A7R9ZR49_9STRA|mmetsp:Transcript_6658/g.18078  ORF Transcript_6658/g.18078 Transcript_6658/m.18078 type:complete len:238 (+) Transcript_6658:59-772(+)